MADDDDGDDPTPAELDDAARQTALQLMLARELIDQLSPAVRLELQAQCYALADAIGALEKRHPDQPTSTH